jgi:hypothetical protein
METCSSETSVDFQRTTQRYIPEDGTLVITTVRTSNPTGKLVICFCMYLLICETVKYTLHSFEVGLIRDGKVTAC